MHEAGIEIVLVVTSSNKREQRSGWHGVKFAMENPRKFPSSASSRFPSPGATRHHFLSARLRQRYTLSHLAKDVSAQVWARSNGSATGSPFRLFRRSRIRDMVKGNESQWGSLSCGCHPNCGVGTRL